MLSYYVLNLFDAITCFQIFNPYEMNIPEMKEYLALDNKYMQKVCDTEKSMIISLIKDLKEFESDTTNPNSMEAFSKDYFQTKHNIEQRFGLVKETNGKNFDNLARKYDDTKPETVDVDALIKDMDKHNDSTYESYLKELHEYHENRKKLAEKIYGNEHVSDRTKLLAQTLVDSSQEQLANIPKIVELFKTGMEKAIIKFFGKSKNKVTKKMVFVVVGSIIAGIALISLIIYLVFKSKNKAIDIE